MSIGTRREMEGEKSAALLWMSSEAAAPHDQQLLIIFVCEQLTNLFENMSFDLRKRERERDIIHSWRCRIAIWPISCFSSQPFSAQERLLQHECHYEETGCLATPVAVPFQPGWQYRGV